MFRPLFRSLRPDFIETQKSYWTLTLLVLKLFRSLRPDFIETICMMLPGLILIGLIVPVSKTGLH